MFGDVVRWTKNFLLINNNINNNNNNKMAINNKKYLCKFFVIFFVINLSNLVIVLGDEIFDAPGARGHYTHTWAVHIEGGEDEANEVASQHGFVNLGKIVGDYYHFKHNSVSKRSISASQHHQSNLDSDTRVKWSKQQRAKSRQKRDFIKVRPIKNSVILNDPKWNQMWYLNRGNNLDMNVVPAWREGIIGKGVVVTILDDGLESDHPDLIENYDPKASYDVNSHDNDPMPHYDLQDSNRHGTRCAGEVAATANNSMCAVGIAYGARVGGVRMLDGDVTDAVEARSLSLNPEHIDIYSASWGPDDDGKTVDGPGEMATRAFIEGVTKGRNGKGSIFVWASGNGGREHDNCNCDGYTNSIWTLSISSATEEGLVPWYSEMCSSTLATTYSSGNQGEKQIVTTDLHHSCTSSHTGTSASAPLAAGIVALALEANRNLTWRDLQHIVVRTAKPGNLRDPTWSRNGVGRRVSHSFGYGLMDAAAMVRLARIWKTVPEQQRCEINAPHLDKTIPPKSQVKLQLSVQHCKGVNFLEHVQAKISLSSQRRGDIQIYLTSPAGTRVTLLTTRILDVSRSGFVNWPFMSVHTWGEAPHGNWILEIQNEGRFLTQLSKWELTFFGTEIPAQPNDPPNKAGFIENNFSNEMEHNSLEFGSSQTASGQWRDSHQVGEIHADIQRTRTNDLSGGTNCLHSSLDHKCLECLPGLYLYEGECYTECPLHTYMAPEIPMGSNDMNKSLQLSLKRRAAINSTSSSSSSSTSSSTTNYNDLEDILSTTSSSLNVQHQIPQKYCFACHPTCLKCTGPFDYECTDCENGSTYTQTSERESYCIYNFSEKPFYTKYFDYDSNLIFYSIVLLISITMILIFFGFIYSMKKIFFTSKFEKDNYNYNQLENIDDITVTQKGRILGGQGNLYDDYDFNMSDSE